jgi:uncharacterized membrane protein YhfC
MDELVRFLNGFLMIAMPLGLGALLARRFRLSWRLFLIGGATFVASQVLHIPFNQWALRPLILRLGWEGGTAGIPLFGVSVLVGLSAGVFEESARYLMYRRVLPKVRDWKSALMLGAGHGGTEAIIIGVLVLINFFVLLAYRGGDIQALVPPEQIDWATVQIEAFWSAPWHMAILGAVERAFALCFHLSASVLVLQVFRRKNLVWLVLAIFWHTALNATGLIVLQLWGAYAAEGALGALALLSLAILWVLRSELHGDETPIQDIPQMPKVEMEPLEVTQERLEDSRFSE